MHDTVKIHAIGIVKHLADAGFKALFAGGAVRDMVLGVEPKDYDIVTNASLADTERLFDHVIPVGKPFGVCRVIVEGIPFEVAVFRKDGVYEDGRRPLSIEPADEIEDTKRRDFTINALLYDPLRDEILDYVDGVNDIKRRVLRTVGEPGERFGEDSLRMLRAVRFAARLSFTIEPSTERSLREMAPAVLCVSAERIGEELSKIVAGPNAGRGLSLLDETGLLRVVLPEVYALKGVGQPPQFHPEGDVFEHTLALLDKLDTRSWPLVLAGLLHDAGKVVAQKENPGGEFYRHEQHGAELVVKVAARLKLSNATRDRASWLVRKHMALLNVREMRLSTLRRLFVEEGFHELLALARADTLASDGDLSWYDFCTRRYDDLSRTQLKPKRLISGDDLIELGLRPGPIFAGLLEEAYDQQLGGDTTTKAEGIAFIKERLRRRPQEKRGRTASDS